MIVRLHIDRKYFDEPNILGLRELINPDICRRETWGKGCAAGRVGYWVAATRSQTELSGGEHAPVGD